MTEESRTGERTIATQQFKEDVINGLTHAQKSLPCKYFYDERGSKLFEEITALEEYYPTRTELAIMQGNIQEIAESIGNAINLIELGSGSSTKTELLLDHADIRSYIPIDIAEDALLASASRIKAKHPRLDVHPIASDYTGVFSLPNELGGTRNVVYFPGSTIGNFEPDQAQEFLRRTRRLMGRNGGLLIGIDLKKDKSVIERAYNDEQGVTARFNLNLLERINRELKPEPPLTEFSHSAIYNEAEGRIEMRLIATEPGTYMLDDVTISLAPGEAILTEYSYKYTLPQFTQLAEAAGLHPKDFWTDKDQFFAVLLFDQALE